MGKHGIPGEMEQNLVKGAIHLHLLSALSEAAVLRHVVFQGGTALRLCYGGERYSEDLDFVCGKADSYVDKIEFDRLVQTALEVTKKSLHRDFDIDPEHITLKQPADPMAIKRDSVAVAAWQIVVPVGQTPRSPKSRVNIEFANVPSYDSGPNVAGLRTSTGCHPHCRKRRRNPCRQGRCADGKGSPEIPRRLGVW